MHIHIQLGLFGCGEVAGTHVVSAHTRVLPDGTQVFVSEHLRWDRGRSAPAPRDSRRKGPRNDDHPSLFAPRLGPEMDEVELFPGAYQLPLWPTRPAGGRSRPS